MLALLVQKYKILTRELEFLQFARDVFVREHAARQRAAAGAQFTCFTGTKGQILTQKVLQHEEERMLTYADVC